MPLTTNLQGQDRLALPAFSDSTLLRTTPLVLLAISLVMDALRLQQSAKTVPPTINLQDQDQLALFVLMGPTLLRETLPAQTLMPPASLAMELLLSVLLATSTMNQEQEQPVKPVLWVSSLFKEMLLVKPAMFHVTAAMEPPLLVSTVQ